MKSLTKAAYDIEKNLVKTFKDASDVALDPHHTMADVQRVWDNFAQACKDTGNTSTDAARGEVKEHVTKHMREGGMSKAEADAWFESRWQNVKDLGDKIIKATPKIEAAAKYAWLKFAGVVTAIFAGAMIIAVRQTPSISPEQQAAHEVIRQARDTQRQVGDLSKIMVTQEQLQIMLAGMVVPSAPAPVADVPAPVAELPFPVAAVAAVPVIVEFASPAQPEPRTYTSTVEQVYRNSPPQAQRQIEQDAPQIKHDYDSPSRNDCVANDCLNQHRDEWNRHINELNAQRQHKDYSITMGDGSSTIGVNY
jgi:hypothetical protein